MLIVETTELTLSQKEAIYQLWNGEYPEKLNYAHITDFGNYLDNLSGKKHYLLVNDNNAIQGWAFSFTRDSEKWFAVILDQSIHGQGYGTRLLDKIKGSEAMLYGWVIDHSNAIKSNGAAYISPLDFYIKNNFVISGTRLETEKISAVKIVWSKE